MAESPYEAPAGYLTMAQTQARLRISRPTLGRLVRDAQVELYEDPRDHRVRLLRAEDVERMAQPVKRAA
jgi:hypothetical protein